MVELFFWMMEIFVLLIVVVNGNKIIFEGLENIFECGGVLIVFNYMSYVDWVLVLIVVYYWWWWLWFMIKVEM